jgi:hypothetical protein
MVVADGEGYFESEAPSGKKLPSAIKTGRKSDATTNIHLFRLFGITG